MKVGFDLDGVVYNFTDSLRNYLVEHKGFDHSTLPDAKVWDFYKYQWGMSTQEWLEHCAEGVDAGVIFRTGEPSTGAIESMQAIKDAGHEIHIATARTFGTKSAHNTIDWLNEHSIPFDHITFTHYKPSVNVDVFIEDNIGNAVDLRNAGIRAFLFDQPWNQCDDIEGIARVFSLEEFVTEVEKVNLILRWGDRRAQRV